MKSLERNRNSKGTGMKTYVAFDPGHNWLKCILQDDDPDSKMMMGLMPSYILDERNLFRNAHSSSVGLVSYLGGQREDLSNKAWLMGEVAIASNEKACLQLASVDGGRGKVDYSLHSLLSLLSKMPHRKIWNLDVVTSNHRADVYFQSVRAKMSGRHEVVLAGLHSVVSINVKRVVDEATHYKPPGKKDVALIDFGGGTTIFIKYGPDGRHSDRQVIDVGVDELIDSIYEDRLVYDLLNKDRSRYGIRKAIENYSNSKVKEKNSDGTPSIWYGIKDKGGRDISVPYFNCLQSWLKNNMAPVIRSARAALREGASLELIGGGAMLPVLDEYLTLAFNSGGEKHSINKVGKLALWTNSLAMLEIAKPADFGKAKAEKNQLTNEFTLEERTEENVA